MNLTQKILNAHLVSGKPEAGEEVSIRIDQTPALRTRMTISTSRA